MKQLIKYIIAFSLGIFCAFNSADAQGVINYLPEGTIGQLTPSQRHYYDKAMDTPFAMGARLATIDVSQFENNTVQFNYSNVIYTTHKLPRPGVPSNTRISWIGKVEGLNGHAHIVYKKAEQMVVGMIEAENIAFLIRPLGNGLHAIVDWDMTQEEGCQVPDVREQEYEGPNPAIPGNDYNNPDIMNSQSGSGNRATGECNIRVLCAYTDDVDAAVADILMDINNMVNIANTGYINSESSPGGPIDMRIELAMAYEVAYNENGTTMEDDRACITNTNDGCLDDIHTQRTLWDADQCVLLTDDGSGIAWISNDYEDQFSVTGRGNFYAHTFHHELGHNAECTHALNQSAGPGVAPYAGYGDPSGCYRTVMAYQDACGTGPGTCPRQNIFSDNDTDQWTCSGTDYTPGTSNNRNQDRLDLSGPIIIDHETVPASTTYGGDYNWGNREAVHFAAENDIGYNSSTNNFEFFSGSEGSFRASNSVTLGEGFWARNGSEFTAYLESCTSFSADGGGDGEQGQQSIVSNVSELNDEQPEVSIFPNPFTNATNIQLKLESSQPVKMTLYNMTGQKVKDVEDNSSLNAGQHTYILEGSDLSGGMYMLHIQVDNQVFQKRLIKSDN